MVVPRQPTLREVQHAVRADPANALSIIKESSGRECAYAWHTKQYQTQYVPVEVERVKTVKEFVDRQVTHPVPDPEVERQLLQAQEELEKMRNEMLPRAALEDDLVAKDKLSLKSINQKLKMKLSKKNTQITDLQTALFKNFTMAKELSNLSCPEVAEIRKEEMLLLKSKVVMLQEVLRHKEEYIQEVTQALIDSSKGVLRIQKETQEVLRTERVESAAAWEETKRLEERTRQLEDEMVIIPKLQNKIRESEATLEDLRQQLEDKDDVIDALEEQFRQTTIDEAADLSRDEVLVRMTQLRFKIGLKNAQALKAKAEINKLREKVKSQEAELTRTQHCYEDQREDNRKLRSTIDGLHVQLTSLRRDLLASCAPVRPIIMPQAIYDDERRLLEAPSAPRTRALTEQDIVAGFCLFDSSAQGELPAWDMPLYLRTLGFTTDDPAVCRLATQYRTQHGTLTLEEFRDVILNIQKEFTPMKMSTENLLGQWQEASKRRVEANKKRDRQLKGRTTTNEDSDSDDELHKNVAAISMRVVPMTTGDIEVAFNLFDHEVSGELDQKIIGTLSHALGLVRTTADLDALNVLVLREFSGTLNGDEWRDLVQYCQGVKPNFVPRRAMEHKPPKERIYPRPFPKAGRTHPLSEREIETAFKLFDVDKSGLLPGHQMPTYLECLGLVCSGAEFTTLLVTQYKADLTQKVSFGYFCRMVRFVQAHLEFFNPSPKKPQVRAVGSDAQEARRAPPILAPSPVKLSTGMSGVKSPSSVRAPPSRPNTAVYSPRTRKAGEYPPWMMPSAVPAQVESIEKGSAAPSLRARIATPPEAVMPPNLTPHMDEMNDFTSPNVTKELLPEDLTNMNILTAYNAYTQLFDCPQVSMMTGSKALALQHVALAVRSLGFNGVTKRFLEQIWPFERKKEAVRQQGGGAGDELILNENEFIKLVRNIERYGTKRDPKNAGLPKRVNRNLAGGALRESDITWVFALLDDDEKSFLTSKDFRTMLTLLGFTLQDEPEIQNVLARYDNSRPSRSSREHNIFELHDCQEVIRQLTNRSLSTSKEVFSPSSSWLC